MELSITVVAFAACFFVLIAVHETGHFLAGWAGGIPARDMRIRLFSFPQHVDLRDGDEWVSPVLDLPRFVEIQKRHFTTLARAYLFVSGGLLTETVFAVVAVTAFMAAGWRSLAFLVALSTFCLNATYLALDAPAAIVRRKAFGDFSGLWTLARVPTVLLVAGLLTFRVLLLLYVRR